MPVEEKDEFTAFGKHFNSMLDRFLEFLPVQLILHMRGTREIFIRLILPAPNDALVFQVIDRPVSCCAEKIGLERSLRIPIVSIRPDVEENFLREVFCCISGTDQAPKKPAEGKIVGLEHRLEDDPIAATDPFYPKRLGSLEGNLDAGKMFANCWQG